MTEIRPRLVQERNGVEYRELEVATDSPPVIDMTANAEIKMKITAVVKKPDDFDYMNDKIVPYLLIDGETYALGKYIPTGAEENSENGVDLLNLTAMDMTYLAKKYKLIDRLYLPAGTRYEDAIRDRLFASGIYNYVIEATNAVLQTDREDWEPGTDNLTIVNTLLAEINYNSLFMDLDGYVKATKYRPPTMENITQIYNNDEWSILKDVYSRKIDAFDHPNMFRLTCDNPEYQELGGAETWVAESVNDSPINPFSTVNQGVVFTAMNVDNIASQQALQDRADNEKMKSMIASDEIAFTTALNPIHSAFEVVALNKREFSGILQETFWRMELSHAGEMEHTGRQMVYS